MRRVPRFHRVISIVAATCLLGSLLGLATAAVDGIGPVAPAASADPVAGGLGYTALPTPCRAVDTRAVGAVGGDLAPGEQRPFQMRGNVTFAAQGGSGSGCGVPSTATAVEVTFTAVSPSDANGFVRAFPTGSAPGATVVNYTVGRGMTNTGTIPLNTSQTLDLGVSNAGGTIHLIVDVQGYFAPSGGASYVPRASPCRVVATRSGGGVIPAGGTRALQVAGTGANFAAQGGTAGGCGVPDGVSGVEVSLTVISPVGTGFARLAPNDGSNPNAAFVNYTDATGITNTGSITLSNTEARDVIVRNFGGAIQVALDVQGFYTTAAGQGTRYQTITPCRTVDTRNAGGPLAAGQTRVFQTGGDRVDFPAQGTVNATGCGIPQRAAAVEASLTAVTPTGSGFTRPGPAGSIATATFLNYTPVGGITNTGTLPLALGGIADLGITNLGGSAAYLVDVLGYYEPPAAFPRSAETIATGGRHTCMIVGGDRVRCWGNNSFGQLGDGTTSNRTTPTPVSGSSGVVDLTEVVQIAAGANHTCVLIADGTARCWGNNSFGQLGDGTTTQRLTPTTVPGLTGVVQITAGGSHACALLDDGTARCWGNNDFGQLGDGTTTQRLIPTTVPGLSGVVQITAGESHACALLADGTARCWGANGDGQLGDGTTSNRTSPTVVPGLAGAIALGSGGRHSCALIAGGTARCWGLNSVGQLGDGTTSNRTSPTAVVGLSGAVQIAVGAGHTCALLPNGTARCWGFNSNGQLGDSTTTDRALPVTVPGFAGAVQIAASTTVVLDGMHTCAVLAGGTVRCWGANGSGQIGDTSVTDRLSATTVSGLSGTVEVGSGGNHSCALLADGTVRCWGENSGGALGDGTTTSRPTPAVVSGLTGAVQVTVGTAHTCALIADGTVRCWGSNTDGQLGDGTTDERLTPTTVSGLTGVVQITAGGAHTCALLANGTRCWGSNGLGQIGDGTVAVRRTSPTIVPALTPVPNIFGGAVQLVAGGGHTCATLTTGTVRCWGQNSFGQIGDNTTTQRNVPTAVPGLTGVVRITAGDIHTCAVRFDSTGRCWGSNFTGQIGDGSTGTDRTTPTAVSGLTGATRVSAGGGFACAHLVDSTVECWGDNTYGQLGDGTTTLRLTPTAVSGLTGVVQISAGGYHACAAVADGTARCWGYNFFGALGDGTNIQRESPTLVTGLP